MTHSQRVVVTIVALQQNRLQRTNQSNDRGLGMMPSFARCLGALVAIGFTCTHLGDLSISPHFVSQHQIVPTSLRSIPNMVKDPLPRMEIFQTYWTEKEVPKVIFPDRFYLVNLKCMYSKLLLGVSTKCATIYIAR